jgi:peptidyl-prolyl cis-trans isomerase C
MFVNGIANPNSEIINASLDKLIEEVAMANIAAKKQLPMTREQMNSFKYLQLRALASNAKLDYLSNNKSSDEELKQEYNTVVEQTKGQEYHVHHLLYTDEIEAITVLDEIKTAEDFKAKEALYIEENPNKVNVGNLGWLNLLQLPKSFKEILPNMTENTVNQKVISSQFGAHIVYLEAIRETPAPAFEDVKGGIENSLKAKKLSKFAQLAKAKSRVSIAE